MSGRGPARGQHGGRLHGLLPDPWQGDGREARWRRARGRRVIAGLLCGVAVLAVVGAVRPADPPSRTVTVAAHDLPAGSRLTTADVRQVHWSRADEVPGALSRTDVTGNVLTGPITAGEPFTRTRVRAARTWPSIAPGRLVVAVPSDDTGILRVLRSGDHVDLISTGRARTVAADVPVVSILDAGSDDAAGPSTGASGTSAAVLLAVTPHEATAIGSATAARSGGLGGGIQLALHTRA